MNRRRTRRIISVVVLLSLLLLSACGSPEKKLQKEDAAIRAALEQEGFGCGDKLAAYDFARKRYSYHGAEIPESMQAEKPEEIGAFVSWSTTGTDENSFPTSIRIRFAFDQDLDFNFYIHDEDVQIIEYGDRDKVPYLREVRLGSDGDSWEMLRRWMDSLRPVFLCLHGLNSRGGAPEVGGGDKLICYDRDAGQYDYRFVSEGMAPRSEAEIGTIFSYSISLVDAEGEYNGIGTVRGTSELLDWELLNAITGEVLDSGEIGGEAPFVILNYNGNRNAGFKEEIGSMEVMDMLRELWLDRGLVWHD